MRALIDIHYGSQVGIQNYMMREEPSSTKNDHTPELLHTTPKKKEIVKLNDSDIKFFGPPSTQIDDAWDYQLHGPLDRTQFTPTS